MLGHGHDSQIGSMIIPQVVSISFITQEFLSTFQRNPPTQGHHPFDAIHGVVGHASRASLIPSLSVSVVPLADEVEAPMLDTLPQFGERNTPIV